MSNLWFFRLKRAEQQRRRSSGEQSLGSASVNSVAGVSVASLPSVQRDQLGGVDICELHESLLPTCSKSICEEPINSSAVEVIVSDELGVCQQTLMAATKQTKSQVELPKVTIIRSDSSSSFMPVPLVEARRDSSTSSEREMQPVARAKTLVSRFDQKQNRVESSCADESQVGGRFSSGADEAQQLQQSSKRGLHDQLQSGKVPPIQERLLSAGQRHSMADSMDNLASLIPR